MSIIGLPQNELHGTCVKCRNEDLEVLEIRRVHYCRPCFTNFAKSKYRRAMDAFRLEAANGAKVGKTLIAFSGGLASSVLVELAYDAVHRSRGKLQMPVVLYIDDTSYRHTDDGTIKERSEYLQARCHGMQFRIRALDEIGLYTAPDQSPQVPSDNIPQEKVTLQKCLDVAGCIGSLSSATSQNDMLALYRDRLILEVAKQEGCSAVIFGNSATSIAAKTLALTAKGRGYALPWETADYSQNCPGLWTVKPLKGLLTSEIQIYANISGMPSSNHVSANSGKADNIDALTHRYFETLADQFPSLVTTVVKTTNKLVQPTQDDEPLGECKICGLTFRDGAREWLQNITVNTPACDTPYAIHSDINVDPPSAAVEDLCYGCLVATKGSNGDAQWPTFAPISSRNNDKNTILSEFALEHDNV